MRWKYPKDKIKSKENIQLNESKSQCFHVGRRNEFDSKLNDK